jgi:hypothetical protein
LCTVLEHYVRSAMNTDSNHPSDTRALRGLPGGPGFVPNQASPEDGHSPWQRSHRLWDESGNRWDLPVAPVPAPVPAPRSASGRRAQVKYQGRHSRAGAPSAETLAAPVLADLDRADLVGDERQHTRPSNRRRTAAVVVPGAVLVTVGAVTFALLTGHGPGSGHPTATSPTHKVRSKAAAAQAPRTVGIYSGQQQRGVFQQIDSVAGYGGTIVTTGSQSSDGQVRQQFFVSDDSGSTWRLAAVQAAGGGQPSLGHAATLIARGPAGWLAVGPNAIWTSGDGLSWTLAAAHGITPGRSGDQVQVLTATATGFVAGGARHGHAMVWVSGDGMSWRAATLPVATGETVRDISSAASRGRDTLISGTVASDGATYPGVWLSTDGGSAWTRVTVPAGHGAAGRIVGLSSDAAGLLAVRAGGVAFFSQNGSDWHYAGTIDPAGGWSPTAVNGGSDGFAVTGKTTAGTTVAYTGTGTGTGTGAGAGLAWTPTASLGAGSTLSPAVAAGGTVVAAGSTRASQTGQQGVLLEATGTGSVRAVPLAAISGGVVPELAMNSVAAAGGVQIAVGSADGYPAIWRRPDGGSWTLVASPALTSEQDHLAALTSVTRGPRGWLAVGGPGPVAFTSADGVSWHPAAGNLVHDLAGASAVAVAAGPAGYVVVGTGGLWWSPDLASWSPARGTGDGTVLAVAADERGFVAVGSHDGKPAVWTTFSGRTWTRTVVPMPAGASSAVLQQIAVNGRRVAALGQATVHGTVVPFAVLSVDGGARWALVPFGSPGPDTAFTALIASAHGFIAVGQYGPAGQAMPAAWTSATGTAWMRTPLSGLSSAYRITALAPAGTAATGTAATAIGSIATEQSQGAFMVGVPAH